MATGDPKSRDKGPMYMVHLASKGSGATEDNVIDCFGFRFARVSLFTGTVGSADLTVTMQEGSLANGSDGVGISGADFTIADADDDAVYTGILDLQKRGRYLSCVYIGSGTAPSLVCVELLNAMDSTEVDHSALRDGDYTFTL